LWQKSLQFSSRALVTTSFVVPVMSLHPPYYGGFPGPPEDVASRASNNQVIFHVAVCDSGTWWTIWPLVLVWNKIVIKLQ